jgi:hypothetical protein
MPASCRNDTTANQLPGTNSGQMQASSEGRNIENIKPTGRAGNP